MTVWKASYTEVMQKYIHYTQYQLVNDTLPTTLKGICDLLKPVFS